MCGTSITAFAATEYVDGYLRYIVEDGSVTITGYNGRESEVTVPSKIAGTPVNTIGAGAFANSSTVTKVNLPDTIMTIEEGAFNIGQTVVYSSNTDDTVVTEPTEPTVPTTPPKEEPTQEPTTAPAETPTQVPSKEPFNTDSDKSASVEEVDVDFEDVSEQKPSVDTTESVKGDEVEEQVVQVTDVENKTGDKPAEKSAQESGGKPVIIIVAVIVLAVVVVGIFMYKKKGRR